jgi:hypothetical protein
VPLPKQSAVIEAGRSLPRSMLRVDTSVPISHGSVHGRLQRRRRPVVQVVDSGHDHSVSMIASNARRVMCSADKKTPSPAPPLRGANIGCADVPARGRGWGGGRSDTRRRARYFSFISLTMMNASSLGFHSTFGLRP